MRIMLSLVVCLCVGVTLASQETYRAGIVRGLKIDSDLKSVVPTIYEAGKSNVDVLVLPSPQASSESTLNSCCGLDTYDEVVGILSEASKAAGLYVVTHLLEKTRCQSRTEVIRSNIVFDRSGNIVSVYRKPLNNVANCTTEPTSIGTFTTDFGVTFGVLMEEDLILQNFQEFKDVKNFVLTGSWTSEIPFLSAKQFAPSWAFVNRVNLISSVGIYAGQGGIKTGDSSLETADLSVEHETVSIVPPAVTSISNLATEDLSLYTIKPVDLVASRRGYEETVCHGSFCCNFYIMSTDAKQVDANYGVAVFKGTRGVGARDVGVAACAVLTCAGLYKRSCAIGSDNNNTKVEFVKISISGNFSSNNSAYPIIHTSNALSSKQFHFESSSNNKLHQVTLEVKNVKNLLNLGIFARDYTQDTERQQSFTNLDSTTPGYIISGDMEEFFDYVWIRLRIVIFLVSIYVLEML